MKSVARSFERDLVLGQMDFVDLNGAQGVGALRRFRVQSTVFVEFKRVFQVAAAQVKRLAHQ